MDAQQLFERFGPTAGITIAILAALLRPGALEGIAHWFGCSVEGTAKWIGRLTDRIVDAIVRRVDSTTRVNEAVALAVAGPEPGSPGTGQTPSSLRRTLPGNCTHVGVEEAQEPEAPTAGP